MNPVNLISTTQAAKIIGVDRRSVQKWQVAGRADRPQAAHIAGRNYLFDETEIREYAAKKNQKAKK
ncbi:hypothetical protein CUW27_20805 [Salmonella enterica]|nr:hypothetical protein [Salmonella enterica]